MPIKFRKETAGDETGIRAIHLASFTDANEANLVEALRRDGSAEISWVACDGDQIVGHIMCSTMDAPFKATGIAPVPVLEPYRKQGIAEILVRRAIDAAKQLECAAIFVLGDPHYYARFGFSLSAASRFFSPYAGPYFMVLSLQDAPLPTASGTIGHAPAFEEIS